MIELKIPCLYNIRCPRLSFYVCSTLIHWPKQIYPSTPMFSSKPVNNKIHTCFTVRLEFLQAQKLTSGAKKSSAGVLKIPLGYIYPRCVRPLPTNFSETFQKKPRKKLTVPELGHFTLLLIFTHCIPSYSTLKHYSPILLQCRTALLSLYLDWIFVSTIPYLYIFPTFFKRLPHYILSYYITNFCLNVLQRRTRTIFGHFSF